MRATTPETLAIRAYVEDQILEDVMHLEKVASELVGPARYDIWDVRSTGGRWWVITNPTNLYHQADFKRHVALHFHIGLMLRTSYIPGLEVTAEDSDPAGPLPVSWRRWEQALEAYDSCQEPEDFQVVGDRLRECLACFVGEHVTDGLLAAGQNPPQATNTKAWAGLLAGSVAGGDSTRHLRSHLTRLSVGTWEYVNWLTRAKHATRIEAEIGLKEVYHFLGVFGGGVPGCVPEQL